MPSLDPAPVARLPVGEFRENNQPGIKIEAEHGFVCKQNGDDLNVGIDFDALNRLLVWALGKLCTYMDILQGQSL